MPSVITTFFLTVAAVLIPVLLIVYFFGIPAEWKREMERQALETMGENKASYMVKDQLSKMPEADQKDLKEVQQSLGGIAGNALKNPLGKEAGESGDTLTSPFTGR